MPVCALTGGPEQLSFPLHGRTSADTAHHMEASPVKRSRNLHRALRLVLLLLTLQLVVAPIPHAMAANKTAVKLASEAEQALEAHNFDKAIDLYGEAWRADPHPEYLMLLARAEHLGGKFDLALEHYQAVLAAPNAAAERVVQARGYANEIERMRMEVRVQNAYIDAYKRGQIEEAQLRGSESARETALQLQAEAAAREGDEKSAASLYFSVYRSARDRDDLLLYKAAVAEEFAQQWRSAAGHLEEYLKRAPPTAPMYSEAVTRLEAVRRRLGIVHAPLAAATQAAPVKPVIVADAPRDDDTATIGWSLVKIGGAVALVGLGSWVWTHNQQVDLDAQLQVGANGKIHDISRAEAADRMQTINTHLVTSMVLGGVGVAAAGVGTYLILRTPSRVAFVPGPVPASVAVAWRF